MNFEVFNLPHFSPLFPIFPHPQMANSSMFGVAPPPTLVCDPPHFKFCVQYQILKFNLFSAQLGRDNATALCWETYCSEIELNNQGRKEKKDCKENGINFASDITLSCSNKSSFSIRSTVLILVSILVTSPDWIANSAFALQFIQF